MFRMLHKLATGRRRLVALTVACVIVLGGWFGGALSASLGAKLSDYSDSASSSSLARADIERATGVDVQQGYLLMVRSDRPIDPSAPPPAIVRRTVDLLNARPEVRAVSDFATSDDPRMVSRDKHSTYVVADIAPVEEKEAVTALQAAVDADPLLRSRVQLSGPTVGDVQVTDVSSSDLVMAETLGVSLLLILLLVVFRGMRAAMLPLVGSLFTILLTLLALSVVAVFNDLSVFALNLVVALGLGLSIDFSLLMLSRYREELAAGSDVSQAVRLSLTITGRTILFSSLIITGALCSLLVFPETFLSSMAIAGVLVTFAAMIYALFVLPAIMAKMGRRLEARPSRRRRRGTVGGAIERGRWYRFSAWVMRHPGRLAVATGAVMVLLALPATGLHLNGVDATVLPDSVSSGAVAKALTKDFDGPLREEPVELVVGAPSSARSSVARYAAQVDRVAGVADVLPPRQLGADRWKIDAYLDSPPLSPDAEASLRAIDALPTSYTVRAAGQTADFHALKTSLAKRLPWALLLVAAWTSLVLFAMTGSIILPIKALVMNLLTLGATLGVLVMVFQNGWGSSLLPAGRQTGLEMTSLVILFGLIFGLSTNYNVFLLSRITEAHDDGHGSRAAVALGLERTGRVVTSAAILFCVAVGALGLSRLSFVEQLGIGAAFAVVLDATLVRAVLVPSLMAIMGKANWWAPRPLRAFHARAGLGRLQSAYAADALPAETAPPVGAYHR